MTFSWKKMFVNDLIYDDLVTTLREKSPQTNNNFNWKI